MSSAEKRSGAPAEDALEELELDLLLEGVYRHYGADFRGYARSSLRRRMRNLLCSEGLSSFSALQDRVLHDPGCLQRLIHSVPVSVTSMFRDPSFFASFREKVVPLLWTSPFVRIWHAGCATGEEVYSLAILLTEAGIYPRCRIYATDMDAEALEQAKSGIFRLAQMQEYTQNYVRAGGTGVFSDYYSARYDHAIFRASLRKNVVFAQHNLVTDGSFNEFNVVLCRNVLIYFDRELQNQVHRLIYQSLRRFGVLCLGHRETLQHTAHESDYEVLDERERIYRRGG